MSDPTGNSWLYFQDLPILILLVSLVYSATRYERWTTILLEAGRWIAQLAIFLGGIGLALWALHRF